MTESFMFPALTGNISKNAGKGANIGKFDNRFFFLIT